MSDIYIQFIGAPSILLNGNSVAQKRQKSVTLLAYLITEQRIHSRERLASMLWPDANNARKQLRQSVYEVRQSIGQYAILVNRDTLAINEAIVARSDFYRLCQLANPNANENTSTAPSLTELKSLCSGEFLEGYLFYDCEELAEWCYTMRKLTDQMKEHALARQVAFYRASGDTDTSLNLLMLWQQLDTYNESVQRQMVEIYLERNEPRQVVKVFNEYKTRLQEHLGVAPSSSLSELVTGIALSNSKPNLGTAYNPSPATKYLKSGSVFIAYQTLGVGPVTLVVINGFMSHVEQIWENPSLSRFYKQLAKNFRVVLFDKRGSGMSDRVLEAPTPDEICDDIFQLVTDLGFARVALFGFSEGGAAAIEFAARYPERTKRLILFGTAAKWSKDVDYKPALTSDQFDLWRNRLLLQWGNGDCIREFAPSQADEPDVLKWWAKTMRLSSSPGEVEKILRSIRDIDVRSRLAEIKCPVHILHKTDDPVVRFGAAEDLIRRLPNARLTTLKGRDHWFWTEQPEKILALFFDELMEAGSDYIN